MRSLCQMQVCVVCRLHLNKHFFFFFLHNRIKRPKASHDLMTHKMLSVWPIIFIPGFCKTCITCSYQAIFSSIFRHDENANGKRGRKWIILCWTSTIIICWSAKKYHHLLIICNAILSSISNVIPRLMKFELFSPGKKISIYFEIVMARTTIRVAWAIWLADW